MIKEVLACSPSEILKTVYAFICTKLFDSRASLIRRPVFIRGRRGSITFTKGFFSGRCCRLETFDDGSIVFGEECHIGDYVHIASSTNVSIGNNVLIASKAYISDTSHGSYQEKGDSPLTPPNERTLVSEPVIIGDNVWIGEGVSILPGSSIGNGSIIGAGAVVCSDVPPFSIAVGVPCRVIKRFDESSKSWMHVR